MPIDPGILMRQITSEFKNERGNMTPKLKPTVERAVNALIDAGAGVKDFSGERMIKILRREAYREGVIDEAVSFMAGVSGRKRFKKGDLITVHGPEYFPFKFKCIVSRATSSGRRERAVTETILRVAEYHGPGRLRLLGWNDSYDFNLNFGWNSTEEVDNVTVTEPA